MIFSPQISINFYSHGTELKCKLKHRLFHTNYRKSDCTCHNLVEKLPYCLCLVISVDILFQLDV